MKRYSGWLAAGLVLFAVLACNLSKNSNNNNSNNSNSNKSNSNSNKNSNSSAKPRDPNADVYIEKIDMAKDKAGDPGDSTSTFDPDDLTIHCVINLNKAKKGTVVKFIWKAVDVTGVPSGEFKAIDYSTNSFENKVHAHLTRTSDWPKGSYEVEVDINGAMDKTIQFTVE